MKYTSKKVKFESDCGSRYDDFKMKNVLFDNGKVCLCESNLSGNNKIILFNKKNGKVLTENVSYGNYYAKNI